MDKDYSTQQMATLFEVVHGPLVAIREQPDVAARCLGAKKKAEVVRGTVHNGWLKVEDNGGFMLIDGRSVGLGKLLAPVGTFDAPGEPVVAAAAVKPASGAKQPSPPLPPTAAQPHSGDPAGDAYPTAGPRGHWQVVYPPRVAVRSSPSPKGFLVCPLPIGEVVHAQPLENGWLQVIARDPARCASGLVAGDDTVGYALIHGRAVGIDAPLLVPLEVPQMPVDSTSAWPTIAPPAVAHMYSLAARVSLPPLPKGCARCEVRMRALDDPSDPSSSGAARAPGTSTYSSSRSEALLLRGLRAEQTVLVCVVGFGPDATTSTLGDVCAVSPWLQCTTTPIPALEESVAGESSGVLMSRRRSTDMLGDVRGTCCTQGCACKQFMTRDEAEMSNHNSADLFRCATCGCDAQKHEREIPPEDARQAPTGGGQHGSRPTPEGSAPSTEPPKSPWVLKGLSPPPLDPEVASAQREALFARFEAWLAKRAWKPLEPIGRLWAISDIHVEHTKNMKWLEDMPETLVNDGLVVAGDVCTRLSTLRQAMQLLTSKFKHVFYVPGGVGTPRSPLLVPRSCRARAASPAPSALPTVPHFARA